MPKPYRNEPLDRKLRARRTKEETEVLFAAKLANVEVPEVFFADPERSEIIMEYVQGTLLKEIKDKKLGREVYRKVGTYAARLHSKGIIHGDLTTKNVILSSQRVVLIDFGLSFISDRIEDRAEDIHLLKQAIRSVVTTQPNRYFEDFLTGYGQESGEKMLNAVKKQMLEIEKRGRYAKVD